jgi:hypothetical protein
LHNHAKGYVDGCMTVRKERRPRGKVRGLGLHHNYNHNYNCTIREEDPLSP